MKEEEEEVEVDNKGLSRHSTPELFPPALLMNVWGLFFCTHGTEPGDLSTVGPQDLFVCGRAHSYERKICTTISINWIFLKKRVQSQTGEKNHQYLPYLYVLHRQAAMSGVGAQFYLFICHRLMCVKYQKSVKTGRLPQIAVMKRPCEKWEMGMVR